MRHVLFLLLFTLLLEQKARAQDEANIWYFGKNAGVDFNQGAPKPLLNGALNQLEGCASWSDVNGSLLFYSDGVTVWNRHHQPMPNGKDLMGNWTTTQSALIVPKPGSTTLYYLFTLDYQTQPSGFRYSVVDMSLAGGSGDVLTKNVAVYAPSTEKLTAVKHANGQDIWIVTHAWNANAYYSHLLTAAGLNPTPITSHAGAVINGYDTNANGYLKASPDGKKLAAAHQGMHRLEVLDFDAATGRASNALTLVDGSYYSAIYGVEFSPESNCLYMTTSEEMGNTRRLYQYNLEAGTMQDIIASATLLDAFDYNTDERYRAPYAMQIGPDGRIYAVLFNGPYLGVIQEPNLPGKACKYVRQGVALGDRQGYIGLPNFPAYLFKRLSFSYNGLCVGLPIQFSCITSNALLSLAWDFGDPESGPGNFSSERTPAHIYRTPGLYSVRLTRTFKDGTHYAVVKKVTVLPLPRAELGRVPLLGQGETLSLNVTQPGVQYRWSDNSTSAAFTITGPGTYWVEVYNDCRVVRDTIKVTYQKPFTLDLGTDITTCGPAPVVIGKEAGVDGATYLWQHGATTPTLAVTRSGTYRVKAQNHCSVIEDSIKVTFESPPLVDLGPDTILCTGQTLLLKASRGNAYTYHWQDGSSASDFTVTHAGLYWVEVRGNDCLVKDTIKVTYQKPFTLDLGPNVIACGPAPVVIGKEAGVDGVTYLWQDGTTTPALAVTGPGTYRVKAWNHCSVIEDSIEVAFRIPPLVELGLDTILCAEQTLLLKAPQGNIYTYRWQDGSSASTFTVSQTGLYWVEVRGNDCLVRDSVFVDYEECESELYIPNVFTPNGDGFNDYFFVRGIFEGTWQLALYNRYGQKVHSDSAYRNNWQGEGLSSGVYFYYFSNPVSNRCYKGWVHLLR